MARPRNQLGRPRRAGALSALAHGGLRPCPLPRGFPLGEVAESLATARRMCGPDPGSARAPVLCPDRATLESIAQRRRRHGAERTGLAASRDGQGRSEAHRAIPDEDSEELTATGVAHRLRNAESSRKKNSSRITNSKHEIPLLL